MAVLRIQCSLQMESGIPEDRPTNVFHVTTDSSPFDPEVLVGVFEGAYQVFEDWMSKDVAETGHSIKIYDLADPEPRAPIWDDTFSLSTAPTGDPLPSEVCVCVSFQGTRVSGESQKRRRGRIYLGELGYQALGTTGRPAAGCVTAAAAFGLFIAEAADTSTSPDMWRWGVYSRVDEVFVPFADGWVDNAFDIQRRRGVAPTSRTTFGPL